MSDTANRGSERQSPLSEREAYVLKLAAEGLTDKEIAARMGSQLTTVRTYWERIRTKLKAQNRAHAVVLGHTASQLERAGEELSAFILRRIADEAIFVVDEEGKILSWNEGVEVLFGYSEEEWVGQNQSIFFLPEEKEDASKELDEAREAGASVHDRWHVRKDGTKFWGSNTVILFDEPSEAGAYAKIVRAKPAPAEN